MKCDIHCIKGLLCSQSLFVLYCRVAMLHLGKHLAASLQARYKVPILRLGDHMAPFELSFIECKVFTTDGELISVFEKLFGIVRSSLRSRTNLLVKICKVIFVLKLFRNIPIEVPIDLTIRYILELSIIHCNILQLLTFAQIKLKHIFDNFLILTALLISDGRIQNSLPAVETLLELSHKI